MGASLPNAKLAYKTHGKLPGPRRPARWKRGVARHQVQLDQANRTAQDACQARVEADHEAAASSVSVPPENETP